MSEPSQFLLYTAPDGAVKVDVFFKNETVWLTQKALAELFAVKVPAINKHLKNIFESGELNREATISKMEIVRSEGGREVEFYNLDAIIGPDIAVGEPGAERSDPNYRDVVLEGRLRQALVRLNPGLPPEALEDAWRKHVRVESPSLVASDGVQGRRA